MKSRRKAREAALRALYEMEVGKARLADALNSLRANADMPADLVSFAEGLVNGVHDKQSFLDDKLGSMVREWDFDRVAPVDRNLMRIAAYELYFIDDMPPAVSINEAIEIAKKYSTAESGKFINGVLARVLEDSPKVNWDPSLHRDKHEEPAAPEPEPEEEKIQPDEAKELSRIGMWKIKEDSESS